MMKPRSAPVTSSAESSTSTSTSSSTRPDPTARSASSSVAIWRRSPTAAADAAVASAGRLIDQENEIGAVQPADVDAIAMLEHALGDRFAVDECAASRSPIPEREPVALPLDFGMIARDVGTVEVQIVAAAAPDDEQVLLDGDGPRAERVGDFESGAGHAEAFGAHLFRSASQLTTSVIGVAVGCSTTWPRRGYVRPAQHRTDSGRPCANALRTASRSCRRRIGCRVRRPAAAISCVLSADRKKISLPSRLHRGQLPPAVETRHLPARLGKGVT